MARTQGARVQMALAFGTDQRLHPGEPAVTLSPLRYHYRHRAEVEAVVKAGTNRDGAFDPSISPSTVRRR